MFSDIAQAVSRGALTQRIETSSSRSDPGGNALDGVLQDGPDTHHVVLVVHDPGLQGSRLLGEHRPAWRRRQPVVTLAERLRILNRSSAWPLKSSCLKELADPRMRQA